MDTLIADVSQDPAKRKRCMSAMPSPSRSAQFVSLRDEYIFSPSEIDFAMGWPHPRVASSVGFMSLVPDLSDFSSFTRRSLSGNAFHLFQAACWFVYIASNTLIRSDVEKFDPWMVAWEAEEGDRQADEADMITSI